MVDWSVLNNRGMDSMVNKWGMDSMVSNWSMNNSGAWATRGPLAKAVKGTAASADTKDRRAAKANTLIGKLDFVNNLAIKFIYLHDVDVQVGKDRMMTLDGKPLHKYFCGKKVSPRRTMLGV